MYPMDVIFLERSIILYSFLPRRVLRGYLFELHKMDLLGENGSGKESISSEELQESATSQIDIEI
jgi:hypothetical protein